MTFPVDPFLTRRLRLQPLTDSMADFALYRALYGNKDVMRQVAPPVPASRIGTSFGDSVRDSRAQPWIPNRWSLRSREDGGDVGVLGAFHEAHAARVELGLLLLPRLMRHGYGAEALNAMAMRLDATGAVLLLWCRHAAGNQAAVGLMQRCGFTLAGSDDACWRWEKRVGAALATAAADL